MGLLSLVGSKVGAKVLGPAGIAYELLKPTKIAGNDEEMLKSSGLGSQAQQFQANAQKNPYQYSQPAGPSPSERTLDRTSSAINNGSAFDTALAGRQAQAARDAIGRSWDDSGDVVKSASGALKGYNTYIGDLGKARDRYLQVNEGDLQKKLNAIQGNRDLITRNQTTDLRDLADRVRRGIFGTNLALGAAAGSSASEAAGKAYQRQAAQERARTLTGYGDQISQENQNEDISRQTYQLNRDRAYKWEEDMKAQAIEQYNSEKKILDRLKSKMPEWKQEDIDRESNARLQELLGGLGSISARARAMRDALAGSVSSMNAEADALKAAGIDIMAPAALDTPQFNDTLDVTGLDGVDNYDTESYYNPNVKYKKREGADFFSNPLVFEGM